MRLLTISNLYPRPDQPSRGMFNAQLFRAFGELGTRNPERGTEKRGHAGNPLTNICLVPEWRLWRWAGIRRWQDPYTGALATKYIPVLYVPFIGRNWSWRTYSSSLSDVKAMIEACDIVYSTWLYPDGVAATHLATRVGKPAWIMVQGSDTFHLGNRCRRKIILDACRQATGLVCVCRMLADRLTEAGVDASKVHVVSNGVDAMRFHFRSREEVHRALALSSPDAATFQYILFVGNLVPVKGPDLLLEAWSLLRSRQLNNSATPQLVIIGDGPMRRALEKQAARLGISNSVVFLGARPHEEIALWLNAVNGLCLPSRSEGMPNVILEALASGLPVVAADVGACREMLEDEPAAQVVDPGRADLLATAMSKMLSIDMDRRDISSRHRLRTWTGQAAAILELITAAG